MTIYLRHLAAWVVAAGGTAALIGIAAAPVAAADVALPTAGDESVSSTVHDLKAQGFNVVVNYLEGPPNVSLSECQVTAIDNPSAPTASPSTVTVTVEVSCPNAN